jgi:AraC-like DNA-binding protein
MDRNLAIYPESLLLISTKEQGIKKQNHIIRLLNEAENLLAAKNLIAAQTYIKTALHILQDLPEKPLSLASQKGGLSNWQKVKINTYIEDHMDCTIRVQDLCLLVNLSQSHFTKAFKESYGKAPSAYIAQQRINQAREKMLSSDHSLAQIALFYGFCDQAHFCRIFRRETGFPPKVWRRLHTSIL